jgi:hypothetical protein
VRTPTLPLPVIPVVPADVQAALDVLTWIAEEQKAARAAEAETGELPAYAGPWDMRPVASGGPRHRRRARWRVAGVFGAGKGARAC